MTEQTQEDARLAEMKAALRSPDVKIALPLTFTHGRGVQIMIKTRKVGPVLLRSEGQTLADLLHMVGTMAEEDGS